MKKIILPLFLCFLSCGDVLEEANRDDWTPDVLAFEFEDIYSHYNQFLSIGMSYYSLKKGSVILLQTSSGGVGAIKVTSSPASNAINIDYISFNISGLFIKSGSTKAYSSAYVDIDNETSAADLIWYSTYLYITNQSYGYYLP